jgi:hypothetical protein
MTDCFRWREAWGALLLVLKVQLIVFGVLQYLVLTNNRYRRIDGFVVSKFGITILVLPQSKHSVYTSISETWSSHD